MNSKHTLFYLISILSIIGFSGNLYSNSSLDSCKQIFCKKDLSITIDKDEVIIVEPGLLLEEPWCRSLAYRITYLDSRGRPYVLDSIHSSLPSELYVTIENNTFGLKCTMTINLHVRGCRNLFLPDVLFRRIDIPCGISRDPSVTGLPIPDSTHVINRDGKYIVSGWDKCEDITLTYIDWHTKGSCNSGFDLITNRRWTFVTPDGRKYQPVDTIYTHIGTLKDSVLLIDYDGVDGPILNCDDTWNLGDNIPRPEVTGNPYAQATTCSNLISSYEDILVEQVDKGCYHKYKIIRKWTAIEWCKGEVKEQYQIIKVECGKDSIPPTAVCPDSVIVRINRTSESTTVLANNFDHGSFDDCGIEYFSFSKDTVIDSLEVFLADSNSTVTIYVFDYFGNIDSCETIIKIERTTSTTKEFDNLNLLYPNPFDNTIHIKMGESISNASIYIIDALGKVVFSTLYKSLKDGMIYDISIPEELSAGLYFIRIDGLNTPSMIKKIVKK